MNWRRNQPHSPRLAIHVEHALAGLDVHGRHELAQEPAPQSQAGDIVRPVVIRRDVGEHVVQLLGPDGVEAHFPRDLARGDRRRIHRRPSLQIRNK